MMLLMTMMMTTSDGLWGFYTLVTKLQRLYSATNTVAHFPWGRSHDLCGQCHAPGGRCRGCRTGIGTAGTAAAVVVTGCVATG